MEKQIRQTIGGNNPEEITRRRFMQVLGGSMLAAAAIGVAGYAYASQIEPHWVSVEHVPLTLPRLPAAFDNFRLVQISDIHLSETMSGEKVFQVAQEITGLKPDLVAITGDFIDRIHTSQQSLADLYEALKPLAAETQVVAVLGNHDYWVGPAGLRKTLQAAGILELPNKVLTLERSGAHLFIAGVDDVWEGRAYLPRVLSEIGDRPGAAILMAHEPDFADITKKTGRFDLQISGHSHGGQVVMPLIGPPVLPLYAEKYPSGLYRLGSLLQYTNRGLGTIRPRVRLNCRPEITVFHLQAGPDEV